MNAVVFVLCLGTCSTAKHNILLSCTPFGEAKAYLGAPTVYLGNHTSRFKSAYYTGVEIERIAKIVERAKSLFSLGILVITKKENEDA